MELLDKTFDLLEYVLLQNGRPVTPSEVSENCGVPLSTSTRILGNLTERGYLDKISRKSGYAPGPMVAALANRDNIYHRLALAASEPVRKLAALTLCPVNLAVWRGEKRIMLVYSGPSPCWQPWGRLQFADHGTTATGRLLLAALTEDEQRKIYPGIRFSGWPEVTSAETFVAECAKLRKDGFVKFTGFQQRAIMGHLIRIQDHPPAAIGFGSPEWGRCDEFFRASADAAREIEFNLKRNFHLF